MSKIIEHVKGSGPVYADRAPAYTADFEFTLRSRDPGFVPTMGGGQPVIDEGRDFNGWVQPNDGTDQFTATYEFVGKAMTIAIGGGRLVPFLYTSSGWNVALSGPWPAKTP